MRIDIEIDKLILLIDKYSNSNKKTIDNKKNTGKILKNHFFRIPVF